MVTKWNFQFVLLNGCELKFPFRYNFAYESLRNLNDNDDNNIYIDKAAMRDHNSAFHLGIFLY